MADTGPGGDAPHTPGANEGQAQADRVVIKKYANRRLYNTASSSYVTLEHLADMVKQGVDFVVYDARTNEDITRQVLTQIIFEAENSGQNMLPIQFLRQLIQLYGHQIQAFVPGYLEMSLDAFTRQQDRMREQVGGVASVPFGAKAFPTDGYRLFEEQVRQNMALFDRAMKMFTPFGYPRAEEGPQGRHEAPPELAPSPAAPASPPASDPGEIDALKRRLDEMQRQIAELAGKG